MDNWIELPIVFIDKTEEEVQKDLDNGVKYEEDEYAIDWCCFRESEIVAFNQGIKMTESTIRLVNGDSYKVALSYQELKKIILSIDIK